MSILSERLAVFFEAFGIDAISFSERWMVTLMHFMWQALLIWIAVAIANRLLKHKSANLRYTLLLFAMWSFPVCVATTFLLTGPTSSNQHRAANSPIDSAGFEATPIASIQQGAIAPSALHSEPVSFAGESALVDGASITPQSWSVVAEFVVLAYAIGVAFFLWRLAFLVWGGRRLRRASKPVEDKRLLKLVNELTTNLGLKFSPLLAWCDRVAVPTVIGIIRPTILLPSALISDLEPKQVETILSHELAHIRRHDLWINLMQRVIESLLFFHPVVWWVSRQLSNERETCCDDLVIASGHDSLDYVGALLRVAELHVAGGNVSSATLAISGNRTSQLERRINRLMSKRERSRIRLNRSGEFLMLVMMTLTLLIPLFLPSIVATAASQDVAVDQENSEPLTAADLVNKLKQRDETFSQCVIALRREWRSEVHPMREVAEADWQHNKHIRNKMPQNFVRHKPEDLPWLKFHTPYSKLREVAMLMKIDSHAFSLEQRAIKNTFTELSSGITKREAVDWGVTLAQDVNGNCQIHQGAKNFDHMSEGAKKAALRGYKYEPFSFESNLQYCTFSCGFGVGNRIISIEKVKFDGDLVIADGCVLQHWPVRGGRRWDDGDTRSIATGQIVFTKDLMVRNADLKISQQKLVDGTFNDMPPSEDDIPRRISIETIGSQTLNGLPAVPMSGYAAYEVKHKGQDKWHEWSSTGCRVAITDANPGSEVPARMRAMMENVVGPYIQYPLTKDGVAKAVKGVSGILACSDSKSTAIWTPLPGEGSVIRDDIRPKFAESILHQLKRYKLQPVVRVRKKTNELQFFTESENVVNAGNAILFALNSIKEERQQAPRKGNTQR